MLPDGEEVGQDLGGMELVGQAVPHLSLIHILLFLFLFIFQHLLGEMSIEELDEGAKGDDDTTHHPVSYTHLDVYKRQVQRVGVSLFFSSAGSRSGGQKIRLCPTPATGTHSLPARRPASVSYTHLDVYKRQMPEMRANSAICCGMSSPEIVEMSAPACSAIRMCCCKRRQSSFPI